MDYLKLKEKYFFTSFLLLCAVEANTIDSVIVTIAAFHKLSINTHNIFGVFSISEL